MFTDLGAAPSKSGHAYRTVQCNSCGATKTARASALRAGTLACRCGQKDVGRTDAGGPIVTPGAAPRMFPANLLASADLAALETRLLANIEQVRALAVEGLNALAAELREKIEALQRKPAFNFDHGPLIDAPDSEIAQLSTAMLTKPDLFADLRAAGQAAVASPTPAAAKRPTLATVLRAEREALGRELTREEKDATIERNVNAPALALSNLPFEQRTPEARNELRDLFSLLVEQLDSPNMFDRPDLRMHVDKIRAKAKRSLDCWESPNYDPSEY